MQINPINNNRTNFKGTIIFKDQCIKLGQNIQPINCMAIPTESIRFMKNVEEPTISLIKDKLGMLSANVRKMFTIDLNKYKTVLMTPKGDYVVTAKFGQINGAVWKIHGTSNFIEV